MQIGLGRALMYSWYGQAWESFLQACGFDVVVSPPTGEEIMDLGIKTAQDEICLPIKIYLGHIRFLVEKKKVDAIFLPHLVKLAPYQFICPKFMGLPDMVRTILPKKFPIYLWRGYNGQSLWSMNNIPKEWIHLIPKPVLTRGLNAAISVNDNHWSKMSAVPERQPFIHTVGVIGHPYCLYDDFLNMNFLERLKSAGVRVLTPEMVPKEQLDSPMDELNKPIFWMLGRRGLAAISYFIEQGIDGIIHLVAFGCGPESMVGEFMEMRLKAAGLPFLHINLDEHSGEAGLMTRLEAFLDLLTRRKKIAGDLSHHGGYADSDRYHLS